MANVSASTRQQCLRAHPRSRAERALSSVFLLLQLTGSPAPSVFDSIQKDVAPEDGPKYDVKLMTGALRMPTNTPSVVMTKKGGKKYRCYLPAEEGTAGEAVGDGESALESAQSVATFLLPIKGTCFYRLEGWWTYEFCFLKSVRQFHQEKVKTKKEETTTITQDNTLGAYWMEPDAGAAMRGELLDDPKTKRKYWRQYYGNGTMCDLTGKPRESEVRVSCAPGEPSYLVSIEEVSTCQYLVQFSSNLLCKHPAFASDKKKESVESIQCEPLDAQGKPLPPPLRAASPPPRAGVTVEEQGGVVAGASAAKPSGGAAAEHQAAARPNEVAFGLGQCLLHRRYNYRGVIVGYDQTCQQSEAWMRSMNVDKLEHGRNQPFYHVLPDTRDRPGAQLTYVAQENILADSPSEPLQHPMVDEMFEGFNLERGRFVPNAQLRNQYPSPE